MRLLRSVLGLAALMLLLCPLAAYAQADAGVVVPLAPPLASPVALPRWLGEVWFWVVLLAPSVVTGLTRYRQFGGLSVVLDLLSFLTHRNSPGTFQVPLAQVSKAPAALALLLLLLASPARADSAALPPSSPARPVIVLAPEDTAPPVVAPLTDVQKAAAAIAAINAAAKEAQAGIQAAAALKPWAETRAGQIVLGCIAGAIVVTSAAGAAAGVLVAVR